MFRRRRRYEQIEDGLPELLYPADSGLVPTALPVVLQSGTLAYDPESPDWRHELRALEFDLPIISATAVGPQAHTHRAPWRDPGLGT